MSIVERLTQHAGAWDGRTRLTDPERNTDDESDSTLAIAPVVGGRFVRIDYTWAYQGRPQEGIMLVGSNPPAATDFVHWADTWHTGHTAMVCTGPARDAGTCAVLGSYAAPPGPDWGWRISLDLSEAHTIRLLMHNIWPDGKEEVAVDATWTRR